MVMRENLHRSWSIRWLDLSVREYLYDSRQVIRAGLEDHFMGKLPVCRWDVTAAIRIICRQIRMTLKIWRCWAAPELNYILGVPGSDDIMLNYQTNAYHDVNAVGNFRKTADSGI